MPSWARPLRPTTSSGRSAPRWARRSWARCSPSRLAADHGRACCRRVDHISMNRITPQFIDHLQRPRARACMAPRPTPTRSCPDLPVRGAASGGGLSPHAAPSRRTRWPRASNHTGHVWPTTRCSVSKCAVFKGGRRNLCHALPIAACLEMPSDIRFQDAV